MHLPTISLAVLAAASYVTAWSDMGHRTVALIARKYLSNDAVAYYDDILANTQGFEFDDAATWADTVKRPRPYTKTWHYIDARDVGEAKDTPPSGCKLVYPSDCDAQKTGCVISAISNQTSLFLDSSQKALIRKEALMYIMHLVGDLHQPLHIEDAFRGGNEISTCFRKRCAGNNLHSVWDSYIPNKITGMKDGSPNDVEKEFATEWADKLFTMNKKKGVSAAAECADLVKLEKCTLKWARESNTWICKFVMQPNVDWLESNDLSLEYYEGAAPIVEELVGKAGARLGAWLTAMHASVTRQENHSGGVRDEV